MTWRKSEEGEGWEVAQQTIKHCLELKNPPKIYGIKILSRGKTFENFAQLKICPSGYPHRTRIFRIFYPRINFFVRHCEVD